VPCLSLPRSHFLQGGKRGLRTRGSQQFRRHCGRDVLSLLLEVCLAARISLPACSEHQARACSVKFPAAPKLCDQSGKERSQCPSKADSHSQRGLKNVRQRQLRRTPCALRRGGLGSDSFDSISDPAQHPACGDFAAGFFGSNACNQAGSATLLCTGATLVPARDARHACGQKSVRFVW